MHRWWEKYYTSERPHQGLAGQTPMRVFLGKMMILVAAALAALAALLRLALIAQMVAWAFSLAASFFPIILLDIFWKRANGPGAIAGIIGGLVTCIFYMAMNYINPSFNVLGISHLAAGLFGMIVNFVLVLVVSLMTKEPSPEIQWLVESRWRPDDEPEGHDLPEPSAEPAAA